LGSISRRSWPPLAQALVPAVYVNTKVCSRPPAWVELGLTTMLPSPPTGVRVAVGVVVGVAVGAATSTAGCTAMAEGWVLSESDRTVNTLLPPTVGALAPGPEPIVSP
jgi:hypothetical protein